MRTLSRPLVQSTLDVARSPDLQTDSAGGFAGWFRSQGIQVACCADGFAYAAAVCWSGIDWGEE